MNFRREPRGFLRAPMRYDKVLILNFPCLIFSLPSTGR